MRWLPDWSGYICAVVASGESVKPEDVARLKGQARVIVVNNGYQIAPWADCLYAADGNWWDQHRDAIKFGGLKVTAHLGAAEHHWLHLVSIVPEVDTFAHVIRTERPGLIGHGGNSGFQALNLAVQFGARKIILIGFDFCGSHWHEKHMLPLKNPRPQTFDKWRARLDGQAQCLTELGVDVVNASDVSVLTAYPKMSIDAALIRWGVNDRGKDLGLDGMRDRDSLVRVA